MSNTASISVITPSRPDRSAMLAETVRSVTEQTLPPLEHLIAVDHARYGPAYLRNQLITIAQGDWLAFLDDDDVLDPWHLEKLWPHRDEADVIIPHCRFDGPPLPQGYYNRPFSRRLLARHGLFPITVLVRKVALEDVGLFPIEARYEDWSAWNLMADRGSRFVVVPTITWSYRRGHHSRTANP